MQTLEDDRGGGVIQPFQVGDHVQLSSGGPDMVVTGVHHDMVACAWFEQAIGPEGAVSWKAPRGEVFPVACLVPSKDSLS